MKGRTPIATAPGAAREQERTVPASMAEMPALVAFLEATLDAEACPPAITAKLMVCLDEIASNVMRYSGASRLTVRLSHGPAPAEWQLAFIDDGTPWDPLAHADPDVTLSAEERPIGGLGLLMVKRMTDDVRYSREDGTNVLRLRISVPATPCSPRC